MPHDKPQPPDQPARFYAAWLMAPIAEPSPKAVERQDVEELDQCAASRQGVDDDNTHAQHNRS